MLSWDKVKIWDGDNVSELYESQPHQVPLSGSQMELTVRADDERVYLTKMSKSVTTING